MKGERPARALSRCDIAQAMESTLTVLYYSGKGVRGAERDIREMKPARAEQEETEKGGWPGFLKGEAAHAH